FLGSRSTGRLHLARRTDESLKLATSAATTSNPRPNSRPNPRNFIAMSLRRTLSLLLCLGLAPLSIGGCVTTVQYAEMEARVAALESTVGDSDSQLQTTLADAEVSAATLQERLAEAEQLLR